MHDWFLRKFAGAWFASLATGRSATTRTASRCLVALRLLQFTSSDSIALQL